MTLLDEPDLRWSDYSLSAEESTVHDLFADFFTKESPIEAVIAAEPLGFDASLWQKLAEIGATSMAVPEEAGGGGAGQVALVLATEHQGRQLAPVPLAEAAACASLLSRHPAGDDLLRRAIDGELVPLGLSPASPGQVQLVHGAPVADAVVVLDGDELVALTPATRPHALANLGRLPLGWVDPTAGDRVVLATGQDAVASWNLARRHWQLATASALVGMADACLSIAVDHARERVQFGVAIGTFQAISHPLADVSLAVEAGLRLVRKAAWFADHENQLWWSTAAFLHASSTAVRAAQVAMHTLGGVGVTESALTHYLRRAKAWPAIAGDPEAELQTLAREVLAS